MGAGARRHGRVIAFDDRRGLGEVQTDDGARLPFHCTQISDGSRTVEIGRTVAVTVRPGLLGRWEACDVEKLG